MSLSCCLLHTFITSVIYSYVNRLFMKTKSSGNWKLFLTVSTGKMFPFMNWCPMYLQMSLSCSLLATCIACVIYSCVNRLIMITTLLGTYLFLITVSTRKMFSFMSWWHMYLQTYLCCPLIVTFNTLIYLVWKDLLQNIMLLITISISKLLSTKYIILKLCLR